MRRVIVSALAMALLPAALFAQTPPTQPPTGQPPTGQPPTGQPPTTQQPPAQAAPAQPAEAKLTFKANAGMLLVQVKPDQTAAFEEMMAKLKTGAAASSDSAIQSAGAVKVYKAAEPGAGGNAFYVLLYDPATPGIEYMWLEVINKTLTEEQQRDPATRQMYERFAASIANTNMLNLTEIK